MTTNPGYHIAHVNIAHLKAPIDSPLLAGFVAELDPVNALADKAAGFVWRLQSDSGDATAIPVFGDPELIINLSVWESIEALKAFAYGGQHLAVMRQRGQWFHRMVEASQTLWWVPIGHQPTVGEAEERLLMLRKHGPTLSAFSFQQPFPVLVEVLE